MRMRRRQRRKISAPSGPLRVEVGFPNGTDSDVLDRAIWNHFGTEHIPERPFLLNAMRDNRADYRNSLKVAAVQLARGDTTLGMTLRKLGVEAQGDVQEEITALRNPENAPETIRRKGSSNPLIDSGQMRQSVTFRVKSR